MHLTMFLKRLHVVREHGHQPLATDAVGRPPYLFQNCHHSARVLAATVTTSGWRPRLGRMIQQLDGVLAVVARVGYQFVQDAAFARPIRFQIASTRRIQ